MSSSLVGTGLHERSCGMWSTANLFASLGHSVILCSLPIFSVVTNQIPTKKSDQVVNTWNIRAFEDGL